MVCLGIKSWDRRAEFMKNILQIRNPLVRFD